MAFRDYAIKKQKKTPVSNTVSTSQSSAPKSTASSSFRDYAAKKQAENDQEETYDQALRKLAGETISRRQEAILQKTPQRDPAARLQNAFRNDVPNTASRIMTGAPAYSQKPQSFNPKNVLEKVASLPSTSIESRTTEELSRGLNEAERNHQDYNKPTFGDTWKAIQSNTASNGTFSVGDAIHPEQTGSAGNIDQYGRRISNPALKAENEYVTANEKQRSDAVKAAEADENNPLNQALKYLEQEANRASDSTVISQEYADYLADNVRTSEAQKKINDAEVYGQMNDDERAVYNYMYATFGENRAEEYKRGIMDMLNARVGENLYKDDIKNNGTIAKTLMSYAGGVKSGLRGLADMGSMALGVENRQALTPEEYSMQYLRTDEDNNQVQKMLYDIAASTGNMTPGLVLSAAGAPGVIGSAVFGASMAGNAYKEALRNGNSVTNASLYAEQQMVDETLTNMLLGGIDAFGGGALKKVVGRGPVGQAIGNAIDKVAKTETGKRLLRSAVNYLGDAASEAQQEYLQFYTENFTKALLGIKNENGEVEQLNTNPLDPEALYSAALGALNAGILNLPNAASRVVSGKNADISNARGLSESLKATTAEDFTSTEAYEAAQDLQAVAEEIAAKEEAGQEITSADKIAFNEAMSDYIATATENETDIAAEDEVMEEVPEEQEAAPRRPQNAYETLEAEAERQAFRRAEETEQVRLPEIARDHMVDSYDPIVNRHNSHAYMEAYKRVFTGGANGVDYDAAMRSPIVTSYMTQAQIRQAYTDGVRYASNERTDVLVPGPARQGGLTYASENATKSQKRIAQWVGNKTGLRVEIREDIKGGADIDLKNGVMRINPNSKNFNQSVAHELTHLIRQFAGKEYQTYRKIVVDALMNSTGESYDALYAQYEAAYAKTGTTPNVEDVIEEMVADGAGQFLNDEKFINQIVSENRSLAEKVVDFFQGIVEALKETMSQKGLSRTSKALRENYERYNQALEVWSNALATGSENYKSGMAVESNGPKYELENFGLSGFTTEEKKQSKRSKSVVYVNSVAEAEQLLLTNPLIAEDKKFYAYRYGKINSKTAERIRNDCNTEKADGIDINLTGMCATIYSSEAQHALNNHGGTEEEKRGQIPLTMNDIASAFSILTDYDEVRAEKNDQHTYDLVFVKTESDGKTRVKTTTITYVTKGLYPGGELRFKSMRKNKSSITTQASPKGAAGLTSETLRDVSSFDKSVSHPNGIVKKQLDMSEPVEQVKNLIAVRNVDSKNIMSMLDLEGLPSPSIAITKDSIGHTAFGDITFIFGRSTIDPQADKRNLVFDADAWTPLYPGIEYDYDRKRIHEGYDQLRSMVSEGILPSYYADRANAFLNRIEFSNSSSAEQIIEDAKSNYGMKAYYLASRGESVEVRSNTTSESMTDEDAALAQRIISEIGEDRLREGILGHPEMREDIKNILRDRYVSDLGYTEAEADEAVENMDKKEIGKAYMLAKSFLKHGQTKTETTYDYDATERAIDEKIDDADYAAWLHEQFDSLVTDRGIRNTKDSFTNSGNRRSFKQLHDPVTAENIVRAMWTGREQGAVAFSGMTAKSVRGASARKYSSVEDMHRNADRLQNVSDGSLFSENETKLLERSDDRLHAVKQEVFDNNGITFKNVDRYANYERAYTEALLDAASKKMSWQKIQKTFSDSGINLTEAQAKEIFDILDELRNLPTDYFEAKPKRVVQWGEIGLAVIPDNADPKIAQRLREVGVQKIETYPAGDDQARLEIERKAESLKFQLDMDEAGEGFDTEGIGKDNRDLEAAAKTLGEILSDIDQIPSKTAISKTASAIRKATGTKESLSKIRDEISTIYEYLAFSRNIDGAEISSILADLAGDLITNSDSGINPADQEVYNEFRNILRSHTFHMPAGFEGELETLGGIGALRREFFGTLNITKEKGSTIDQLWEELADQYPEYFDRDVVNPADQLERIVDMIRSLKPSADTSSMTDEDYEIYRYSVGQDILKAFIENSQRTDLKNEYQQKLEKGLQKAKERVQEQRRKEKIRKLDREARSDLLKKAQRLSRMKGGPEFEAAKQELIGNLDLVAKGIRSDTKAKLEALRAKAEELAASDEDYKKLYYENAKDVFSRLEKVHIKDMTGEDVANLTSKIIELMYQEQATKRMMNEEMGRRVATVGSRAISQQGYAKGINRRNVVGATWGRYKLNMLNPVRAMQMLDGYQPGGVFTTLGRQLNDGQTKQKTFIMNASKKFNGFLDQHRELVKTWNKQDIDTGYKDKDGKPVYISKGMRISLYLHSLNQQNRTHIAEAGIEVPDAYFMKRGNMTDAYGYATTLRLKPSDIERIVSQMTPDERAFADLAHEFLNKDTKDAINETSLTLTGTLKAVVEDYFPIKTDKNFTMGGDISGLVTDGTIEGMGMLKERVKGAKVPILLEDVAQVLQRQINNTALYYGLAVPVRDANKVLKFKEAGNTDSVRNAVNKTWGSAGIQYIEGMLRDLQTGASSNSGPGGGIFSKVKSTYAGTVLNWNLGVAIKQSASAPFAAVVLDAKSIAKAFALKGIKKADYDYMDSITPWSYMRRQGMSGTEMGEVYRQQNPVQQNQAWQKVKQATNWIQNVDVWTTDRLFFATEYYVQDHYPDLEVRGEEYNKKVAELYNEMLQRTQPSYDVMQRNAYLRSENPAARIMTMFKTQTFNMGGEVIDAWARMRATDQLRKDNRVSDQEVRRTRAQFGRTVAATVTSQLMLTALGIVAKAVMHNMKNYRDDKGEVNPESIAARGIYEFMTSFSGMLYGGNELQSLGLALTGNEQWYDLEYPGISVINELASSSVDMTNAFRKACENGWDGESADKFRKKAITFSMNAAIAGRIPANNIYNLGNALYLWNQDRANNALGSFDAGEGLFGLKDSSPDKLQYANRAVDAATKGDYEKAAKALEGTNKDNLSKALGIKVTDKLFARFMENPEDMANYVSYTQDGTEPKLTDVKDESFSSFEKLRESIGDPDRGSNWHHIVEQEQGPGAGNFGTFKAQQIHNVNNIISVPSGAKDVHQDITKYFNSVQDFTNGQSVRKWLAGKSFEEQWQFGMDKLREYGDVVPTERGWVLIPDDDKIAEKIPLDEGTGKPETTASKLKSEMSGESVKGDDRYTYLVGEVNSGNLTGKEVAEWADTYLADTKDFKAWKDSGYASFDYVKYKADVEAFDKLEGKKKTQALESYAKKISDKKKRQRVWTLIIGRSEKTCP